MDDALTETLDVADYRRRMAALYAEVRALDPRAGWRRWCEGRDELFRAHPASAWAARPAAERGAIPVAAHDPGWRFDLVVRPPAATEAVGLPHSGDGVTMADPLGTVTVPHPEGEADLTVYWLRQYGGGLFVPFTDATSGDATYGGGRYLLDGAKSADLGGSEGRLVLDFNFAYHPSCVHDPRWSCPLAPPGNRLPWAVPVGERLAVPSAEADLVVGQPDG